MPEKANWDRASSLFPGLALSLVLTAMGTVFVTSHASSEKGTMAVMADGGMEATRRSYCERALQELGREASDIMAAENAGPLLLTLTFADGGNFTCKFIDPAILSAPVVRIGGIELDGQDVPADWIDSINIHNAAEEHKRQ